MSAGGRGDCVLPGLRPLTAAMTYVALYRKYRSQTFDELMGQRHVTQTLRNALKAGHAAHAYLFCGPRGTGKTTTARLVAKALNCDRAPTDNPCNQCDPCRRITEGRSMDVIEIDAASNRGIDDIKELREQVRYAPSQERCKCYIIDEVHQLSADAFNALLKTLEEPPKHVYFILATTEVHKVPKTIVSRCQRFDFRTATVQDLVENLRRVVQSEGIRITDDAIQAIARAANGGWRDSLSLLEQVASYSTNEITADEVQAILGSVELSALFSLADAVAAKDAGEVFRCVDRLLSEGKEPRRLLTALGGHFRDLMLTVAAYDHAVERYGPELASQYKAQAEKMPARFILHAAEALQAAESQLRWTSDHRLLLELTLVKLTTDSHTASTASLQTQQAKAETPPQAQAVAKSHPSPQAPEQPALGLPKSETASAAQTSPAPKTRQQHAVDSESRRSLSLEWVQQAWPTVVERLTPKALQSVARRAVVVAVEGRCIKLSGTKAVVSTLARENSRQALERTLKDVLDVAVTVKVVEGAGGQKQNGQPDVPSDAEWMNGLVPPPEEQPDLPPPWDLPPANNAAQEQKQRTEMEPNLRRLADLFDAEKIVEEGE
ncbi:MAG: DNA polymerase III subunit gamma/tau [Armatimonadota bacterium]